MNGVFFTALRRLRWPLIVIILIFSVSTIGLALIPGTDADGNVWRPTIFEALYFVSYTATTIGFGELPPGFNNIQRLWVTGVIYLSVVGWAFLLGSLLGLFQDKGFVAAIVESRFTRRVRNFHEPFFLICGLGETGLIIAQSLDRIGFRFVVLDKEERRIQEFDFQELTAEPPAFAGDASKPEILIKAGLTHPRCQGLLALTNNDNINLSIAVAARLLRPDLRVVCRSESSAISASMTSVGVETVINPFHEFADRLAIAMRAPDTHRLLGWLTEPAGTQIPIRLPAPPGRWIVCGYGRFGAEIVETIAGHGFEVVIIDPMTGPAAADGAHVRHVAGLGTNISVLHEAGIDQAEGIVAGTDNDTANLAISLAAKQLNPNIFVIARQNLVSSQKLFTALDANMTMVSSAIVANECLAALRTAHIMGFLKAIRARDNNWAVGLTQKLNAAFGEALPEVWACAITPAGAPGLLDMTKILAARPTLADILRDPVDRTRSLAALPLAVVRGEDIQVLPPMETELLPGDEILLAGSATTRQLIRGILMNSNTARYILAG